MHGRIFAGIVVDRTRDGGRSFETLRTGLPQSHCHELLCRHGLAVAGDRNTLKTGGTTVGLWSSRDAGDAWETVSSRLPPIYLAGLG